MSVSCPEPDSGRSTWATWPWACRWWGFRHCWPGEFCRRCYPGWPSSRGGSHERLPAGRGQRRGKTVCHTRVRAQALARVHHRQWAVGYGLTSTHAALLAFPLLAILGLARFLVAPFVAPAADKAWAGVPTRLSAPPVPPSPACAAPAPPPPRTTGCA